VLLEAAETEREVRVVTQGGTTTTVSGTQGLSSAEATLRLRRDGHPHADRHHQTR